MAPPVKYATEEEKREARIASKKRYYQRHKEAEQEKARLRWRARKQRERYSSSAYGSPETCSSTSPQASPSPASSPPLSPPEVDDFPGTPHDREAQTLMVIPSSHIGLSPNSLSSLPSPKSTTRDTHSVPSTTPKPVIPDNAASLASPTVNDIERPLSPSDRFLLGRFRPPAWPTLSHSARPPSPYDASAGAPLSNQSPKLAASSAPVSAA
ncbi:hypothetical protein EXIGLDRAFT_732697 [Exidia glandulosa HHB12029]|uniref:Uncharacterized protein n=1 Tax=Exidia glandulosa HHB12029 TaxID=1314781 RepID=A0A165KPV9_EXIGL|nr:hypothetical protein EXIGLDRAFT_732697 [Exidia glandulosa HHB12029]